MAERLYGTPWHKVMTLAEIQRRVAADPGLSLEVIDGDHYLRRQHKDGGSLVGLPRLEVERG